MRDYKCLIMYSQQGILRNESKIITLKIPILICGDDLRNSTVVHSIEGFCSLFALQKEVEISSQIFFNAVFYSIETH